MTAATENGKVLEICQQCDVTTVKMNDMEKGKIMYVFLSEASIDRLIYTILPQIEDDTYNIKVVGMCFFDENANVLNKNETIGRQLAKLAVEKNIKLMVAEKRHLEKTIEVDGQLVRRKFTPAECAVTTIVDGEQVACFPDVHSALGEVRADYLISL